MRLALFALTILVGLGSTLRAADAPALLTDDFATLRPGWGAAGDAKSVSGNRLLLNLKADSAGHHVYADGVFDNADIRVTLSEIKGESDSPGGIIFWAGDGGECYTALLQADGVVYVARRIKGKWLTPVASRIHESVRKGVGQENELRVVTSGATVAIYVNNREVTRFRGFPPAGGGKIGLHAESVQEPATWAFANLRVFPGPVPAAATESADDSLLLADDFSTLDPGWGPADEFQSVGGNKLNIHLPPNKIRRTLYSGSLFENVDVRLRIAENDGDTDQLAGLIFWAADSENHYSALVRADGGILVARRTKGKWLNPVSLEIRDEVRKGLGQENELRVVTSGRSATIYVNDRRVTAFLGLPPRGGSKIGIHTESGGMPAAWAYSNLSVRQASAPDSGPVDDDPSLLLADDFSRLDPGWRADTSIETVRDNRLVVNLAANKIVTDLHQGFLFDDVDIRIAVSETAGGTDQPAGVIFWAADNANYYSALIKSDGSFFVARRMDGRWLNPVGVHPRSELRKGLGQENELRVVTSGRTATIYINDQKVATLRGFPPPGGSKIGVHAESGADPAAWAFSKLRVLAGPAPASPEVPRDESLLLSDDFSTLDPAWGDADEVQHVEGNQFVFTAKPGTTYSTLYRGSRFGNVDVSVKIAQTEGGVDEGAGVVFWAADYSNLYKARFYYDGTFGVFRRVAGKWERSVHDQVVAPVKKGLNQVNEMRVVTSGNVAMVYLNGEKAAQFEGSPPQGGSQFGFRAGSGSEPYRWTFSDLRVRRGPDAAAVVADSRPKPQPLPDKIIEAWEEAGATVCWMRLNEFGLPQFPIATGAEKEGKPGDLPAFRLTRFDAAEIASLPAPQVPFGIVIIAPSATDAELKNYTGFKNLEGLSLAYFRLTDEGLNGLADLTGLQTLQITSPHLTDEGLKELAGLTAMRSLTLTCPEATDATAGVIAAMTKLRVLNMSSARLTDAGLRYLAGLSSLERLNIENTKVTDAGLTALAGLKTLRTLDLRRTAVTEAGVAALRQALPDCVISR